MFSARRRADLRESLVAAARSDTRIAAAALVGSAARDDEDQWSDIDLALRLGAGVSGHDVIPDWTAAMYQVHGALAHVDLWSGLTLFRVFLLQDALQVDLSFWPWQLFAQSGGAFRLLFGDANEPMPSSVTDRYAVIGMGWLYALHARSSIARGRTLQASLMIDGIRERVICLACLRHDVPAEHGRGADDLPAHLKRVIVDTFPARVDLGELGRCLARLVAALLEEVRAVDVGYASRLDAPLGELVRSVTGIS